MNWYVRLMSDAIPTEATVTAWARLMRAQRVALQAVEADLKAAGFPALGWYDALLELRRTEAGGLRPVELEAQLLLAQHNVSRLIDRLQSVGYVNREPCDTDGRGQMIVITEAGRELLKRMWPVYRAAIQAHVGEKIGNEADSSMLAALLGRLT
jgi:DNA-binding MarR family transcriptional regulator